MTTYTTIRISDEAYSVHRDGRTLGSVTRWWKRDSVNSTGVRTFRAVTGLGVAGDFDTLDEAASAIARQWNLREYSDEELRAELHRRGEAQDRGRCDACGAWHDEPTCGSPRHGAAADQWYRRWRFEYGSIFLDAYPSDESARLSVSRYGARVTLFGPRIGAVTGSRRQAFETNLPVDFTDHLLRSNMSDVERLHWAIDWAIGVLGQQESDHWTVLGRQAHAEGEPCSPPGDATEGQATAWTDGWEQAREAAEAE